jgi:hypothetical protein
MYAPSFMINATISIAISAIIANTYETATTVPFEFQEREVAEVWEVVGEKSG